MTIIEGIKIVGMLDEIKDVLAPFEGELKEHAANLLEAAKGKSDEWIDAAVAHLRGTSGDTAAEPQPEADASGAADPAPDEIPAAPDTTEAPTADAPATETAEATA